MSTVDMAKSPPAVVWHELECGGYRADLALWRRLTARKSDAVLDIGAGTGRVALDLARHERQVIAVDLDAELLEELGRRAAGLPVRTVLADARELDLPERDLGVCLVPMQTVQLLGGADGRARFLAAVRRHLRPDGLLACALTRALEPFDADGPLPSVDRVRVGDTVYASQPTALRLLEDRVVLERRRQVKVDGGGRTSELDVIELDRLAPSQLEREAQDAGWRVAPRRTIEPTLDHSGSTVVMLRA